jgi:hypothetical protein
MEKELLAAFLPEGILEWFEIKEVDKNDQTIRITFEEKNIVPELPENHRGKNVVSKGFKRILIDDFPIRGRKAELVFLRRLWQIEGEKELLKRDIKLVIPGTTLSPDFADFLKKMCR